MCAQVGIQNNGNGVYTIMRVWVDVCSNACPALTGYDFVHCWENAAPGNLPPNSLAVWDYSSNQPVAGLPNYNYENGKCMRMR